MKTPQKLLSFLAGAVLLAASNLNAATTQAVGYSTWTIEPGTGVGRIFTPLALPLYAPSSTIDGSASGTITSYDNANNTITVSSAGWTPGQLSQSATPTCLRVTSGTAEGRNLIISTETPNTSETVIIDLAASEIENLDALSLVPGTDTFELVDCDTFGTLFGTPQPGGFIGSATFGGADQILFYFAGSLQQIYYDTDLGYWTKEVLRGSQPDLTDQIIPPDAGLFVSRLANESSEIVITGTVPDTKRNVTISAAGVSLLGSAWPVDTTLAQTGISGIEGWQNSVSSSDSTGADIVTIFVGGTRTDYFFDGTNWREDGLRAQPISDGVVIKSGSCVIVSKTAPHTSDVVLTQPIPYTL